MIDLEPNPTDFAPRPKRKYTVTDRVLAACRANLERANAVPREIRFRSTEKRRHACHHNLTLALIAKKRDRSARYATCFRHGWYVADPERALALVGATPEAYHRHLEAWRREIAPQDATEEKLAHAIGMLSWRWIAGVRLECDLETLKVYRLLDDLAAVRRPGGPGTEPYPVTEAQLTWLEESIGDAIQGYRFTDPLEKIGDRMLRLWQELLRWRGEPLIDPKDVGCCGRRHVVAIEHQMHSSYELGDPFNSCRRNQAVLCPDPAPVPPVEQWRNQPVVSSQSSVVSPQPPLAGDGPEVFAAAGTRLPTPDSQLPTAHPAAHSPLRDTLTAEERAYLRKLQPSDLDRLQEARRLGLNLPGEFDEFLRRVQAALGGSAGVPPADSAGIPPAPAFSGDGGDHPGANSGAESGGNSEAASRWARRVRLFARALWNCLRGLGRHANDLLALLDRRLGNYSSRLWCAAFPESLDAMISSAHALAGQLTGKPGRPAAGRARHLADFYYELRVRLGRGMYGRWQRCRAAVAVLGKVDSRQLTVKS